MQMGQQGWETGDTRDSVVLAGRLRKSSEERYSQIHCPPRPVLAAQLVRSDPRKGRTQRSVAEGRGDAGERAVGT